jgi:hypothetical protein
MLPSDVSVEVQWYNPGAFSPRTLFPFTRCPEQLYDSWCQSGEGRVRFQIIQRWSTASVINKVNSPSGLSKFDPSIDKQNCTPDVIVWIQFGDSKNLDLKVSHKVEFLKRKIELSSSSLCENNVKTEVKRHNSS